MNTLINTRLFEILNSNINNPSNIDEQDLIMESMCFMALIQSLMVSGGQPLHILRTLRFTRAEFLSIAKKFKLSDPSNALLNNIFFEKMLSLIDSEIDIVSLAISNPHLCLEDPAALKSELYWADDLTLADLLELIVALWVSRSIRKADGSKASFSSIVRAFEHLLNVKFNNLWIQKTNLLNRKTKLTHYLDWIKAALVDISGR